MIRNLFFLGVFFSVTLAADPLKMLPAAKEAEYRNHLPTVSDPEINWLLKDPRTVLYDADAIVPGYQDSMGYPKGFRPNTLQQILIDGAVPGGWAKLFETRGRFHFPFGTGGADLCDNMKKFNFWAPPLEGGHEIPVAYWKTSWSRVHWVFPVGTRIGEVLLVNFPDSDSLVFEVRVRTRLIDGWDNQVYRPFPTATDLAERIKKDNIQWELNPNLSQIVKHLENNQTLVARTLEAPFFPGTFETSKGHLDILPAFEDMAFVKRLLKESVFQNVAGKVWKKNGEQETYAASTEAAFSIVPRRYDGGMLKVDNTSCKRCHDQGGRQIENFYHVMQAYGELWGEDQIFSWHPFENKQFVLPNGDVTNFNNDNRRIRKDLLESGLVKQISPSQFSTDKYQALPHSWKYDPF